MNKIARITLALASVTLLAGCAKSVTADEAKKIADGYSASKALEAKFTKVHVVNKYSDASQNEEHDATGTALAILISAMPDLNKAMVYFAAGLEGTSFKADGNNLELNFKSEGSESVYKISDLGLTQYSKVTEKDGSWMESTYTWTK